MKYDVSIKQSEKGLINNANDILAMVNGPEYKKYNYVVTENNRDAAKKDVAKLNKEVESAKRKRIDFEKKMLEDWDPIKSTLMQAEKVVEAYSDKLNASIKSLDKKAKEEKKAEIQLYFKENCIDEELDIPFEKVFREDMLTKNYSKKRWQTDIRENAAFIKRDYQILNAVAAEDKSLLKTLFLQYWDSAKTIAEYNRQEEIKKKAEEIKKKEAERRESVPASTPIHVAPVKPSPVKKIPAMVKKTYEFCATEEDLVELERWMVVHDIVYKEIK